MKRLARGVLLLLMALVGFSSAAPQLPSLEARVSYRWAGLSPSWPGYDYVFACAADESCTVRGARWEKANGKKMISCPQKTQSVTALEALQALRLAATRHLKPVQQPLEVIDHTDDYPRFEVALTAPSGTVNLLNTSNGEHRPWNVRRAGQWFAQTTEDIEVAVAALLKLVPCEKR